MGGYGPSMPALEAVRSVAAECGIPTGDLKPCIAYLLDGNLTARERDCAFTLAIELRRLGYSREQVQARLERWARTIGWKTRNVDGAVKSAFLTKPDGGWRYQPPGVKHKPGGTYDRVLGPVCRDVGCPANCPAFSGKFVGQVPETLDRFERLGWPRWLKKRRWHSTVDVYSAICRREKQIGLAPGVELRTTYRQLAELADVDHTTVGDALRRLAELGLVEFTPGSGDGPHARNRVASRVRRVVPIPDPPKPGHPLPACTTGGQRRPDIGGPSHQEPAR
jgi:DNA-binding transcriptional ArsR family regulator